MGKGSSRRPGDEEAYRDGWDRVFRKSAEEHDAAYSRNVKRKDKKMKNLSVMFGAVLSSLKRMSVWDIIFRTNIAGFILFLIFDIKCRADAILLALFLIFLISSYLPHISKRYACVNKVVAIIYWLSLISIIVFLIYTW